MLGERHGVDTNQQVLTCEAECQNELHLHANAQLNNFATTNGAYF